MFRRPPISLLVERETHELKGLYSPQPYKMMPAVVSVPGLAQSPAGTTPHPAAAIPRCVMIRHVIMSTG
jgi:hypothetical protein